MVQGPQDRSPRVAVECGKAKRAAGERRPRAAFLQPQALLVLGDPDRAATSDTQDTAYADGTTVSPSMSHRRTTAPPSSRKTPDR